MSSPVFRRILRRETHSPRTVAMIVAVVLLLVVLVYIGVEIVLYLAAQPALLLGPAAAATWLIGLPTAAPAWLIVLAGVVVAILGFVFLFLAVAPGRLSKHRMESEERAVLIDNGVIAASVAQHVSDETGIARDDITVGVSHRTVDVSVREAIGVPVDKDPIQQIVSAEVDGYRLTPTLKTRVRVVHPKQNEEDR